MATGYVVVLQPNVPQELNELLGEYIEDVEGTSLRCLLCIEDVEQVGYFLHCHVMKSKVKGTWKVRVPTQYVLAVVQAGKDERFAPGFAASKKH